MDVAIGVNELVFAERRLYGRLQDCQLLFGRYRTAVLPPFSSKKQNVVLIGGVAGVGKSALATSLRGVVEKDGGLFLSGKFEQHFGEPFEPFCQAFTEFTDLVFERYPERVDELRSSIVNAVGNEGEILTTTIPALARLIGEQKNAVKVKGSSAVHRFHFVFREFLKSICDEKFPLVLHFDDIQWADASSLELLRILSTCGGDKSFFVVCTHRPDSVSQDSQRPFAEALQDMESNNDLEVTKITLECLKLVHVNEMVSDALLLSKDETSTLSDVVHRHSRGNPMYIVEFLKILVDQGLVYKIDGKWAWDVETILSKVCCADSIVDLVASKMRNLSADVRAILKASSCLGRMIDSGSLGLVAAQDPSLVAANLRTAVCEGLLIEYSQQGRYCFPHDKIQQAAYSLISEEEKSEFHIEVGRSLWRGSTDVTASSNIFVIVNLLYKGIDLIADDSEERIQIAELHLVAGEKAALLSAFSQAGIYLRRGIKLLGKSPWSKHYDLTLALHDSLAEVEASNANFDRVKILIDEVKKNARSVDDKIRSYFTLIHSMASEDYVSEAIEYGIGFLRDLGEPFPKSIDKYVVMKELIVTKWALVGKSNKYLLGLPKMTDSRQRACAQLLNILFVYTYLQRSPHVPIIACRAIRYTLKHGLFAGSSTSFAVYGSSMMSVFGNVGQGRRFSELAHSLMALDVDGEYMAMSNLVVITGIDSFHQGPTELVDTLKYASRISLGRGDLAMAGLHTMAAVLLEITSGTRISVLESEAHRGYALLDEYNQQDLMPLLLVVQAYAAKLSSRSESNDPTNLEGPHLMVDRAMQEAEERSNHTLSLLIHMMSTVLAYMFQDYVAAYDGVTKYMSTCLESKMKQLFSWGSACFYMGLTCICLAREQPLGRERRRLIKQANKMLIRIKKWALSSPHHFIHRQSLLEAEITAIRNMADKSIISRFELSIHQASQHGYLHEAAMASERASEHCNRIGDKCGSAKYFSRSRDLYEEYGAVAKVVRMKVAYPFGALYSCANQDRLKGLYHRHELRTNNH